MRKRSKPFTPYYIIWATPKRVVQKVIETNSPFDDKCFARGNYYSKRETAEKKLQAERNSKTASPTKGIKALRVRNRPCKGI